MARESAPARALYAQKIVSQAALERNPLKAGVREG